MCGTKRLNPFFRLHEASEVLNKYVMGVWSNNFTAAFFVSVIVTFFVPDNAVVAQLWPQKCLQGLPKGDLKKLFRHYGTSRGQMAFTTKYPNFLLFYFTIFLVPFLGTISTEPSPEIFSSI